jgi:hypothetical protein
MTQSISSSGGLSNVVQFIVRQFLTDNHYSTLHTTLSTRWEQHQSLTAAVKLMEQYGVTISPEEEKRLFAMDEGTMIETLVSKMPQQTKEQFEHFFSSAPAHCFHSNQNSDGFRGGYTWSYPGGLE